jgi:HJR/Mrr/RecB family endonuclease
MTDIFPSKSEYNNIILQVNLHGSDVYFPYRPMRSAKKFPAIDTLDMYDVMHAREFFVCVHYHFTADCKPHFNNHR